MPVTHGVTGSSPVRTAEEEDVNLPPLVFIYFFSLSTSYICRCIKIDMADVAFALLLGNKKARLRRNAASPQ